MLMLIDCHDCLPRQCNNTTTPPHAKHKKTICWQKMQVFLHQWCTYNWRKGLFIFWMNIAPKGTWRLNVTDQQNTSLLLVIVVPLQSPSFVALFWVNLIRKKCVINTGNFNPQSATASDSGCMLYSVKVVRIMTSLPSRHDWLALWRLMAEMWPVTVMMKWWCSADLRPWHGLSSRGLQYDSMHIFLSSI